MGVQDLRKAVQWAQALSLDVVLGSGLLSLTIAKYYGVRLPLAVMLSLMLALWLIYTYDHLRDAKKVPWMAATFRHKFHQQHYKALSIGVGAVALAGLCLLPFLPLIVVYWGLGCAACVAAYFFLIRLRAFWPKELLIAGCYTFGVFLGPLSLSATPLTFYQLLLIPQIVLLAFSNLIIFSYFDCESDQQDGHYSLAIHLGAGTSRRLALALLIAGLALCVFIYSLADLSISREVQQLVFVMNLLLLMLLLKKDSFRRHELYRLIGDGIFFIPALLLL
jgi:4-hydroxybenzoate polyprenyltransferase